MSTVFPGSRPPYENITLGVEVGFYRDNSFLVTIVVVFEPPEGQLARCCVTKKKYYERVIRK